MSVVPTKIVEGDVAVDRNVTAGGDATVRGHAKVDKNLRVGGWLDARHVKRDCRGLYLNGEQLRREQAEPLPGWWAIVGGRVPGPLWHAEKSEESGRYEWVPVLDENGKPVIGGYTEVDTNPLLEDWNRLDERINQEAEDRQTGDAGLLKLIQTEAGVRQEADTAIEAKADTAIQLGNTANAANSRQDGEIATLQDSVKGLSIDFDFLQGMVNDIPVVLLPFKSQVYAPQEIKDSLVYFCVKESAFMTLRSDNTVGKVTIPYNYGDYANDSGPYLFYQISNKKIYSVIATDERTRRLMEYCAETMQDTVTGIRTSITELAETVEEMGQKVAKASELRYFDAILPDTVPGQLEVMTLPTGAVYFRDGAFWINKEDNHKTPHPEYNHQYEDKLNGEAVTTPDGTVSILRYSRTALPGIYCMRGGAFSVADELYFCLVKGTDKQGYATTLISLSSIKNMIANGEATDEDVDTAADEVFGAIETETT